MNVYNVCELTSKRLQTDFYTFANWLLHVCELTRDVCETTVGETTRWRNDRHSFMLYLYCEWINFESAITIKILVHWIVLISLTLAPLVKTQLKSEFLPILLRVNAYQCCIPFCFSTEQNRTNRVDWVRLGSVIELNRTHKKAPVRLCSIAEPIELQSNDWVRLVFGSVSFDWLRRVKLSNEFLWYFIYKKHLTENT